MIRQRTALDVAPACRRRLGGPVLHCASARRCGNLNAQVSASRFIACGWQLADHADPAARFLTSVRGQLEEEETHAEDLETLLGADEAVELRNGRRSRLSALGAGLIRRELFHAVPVKAGGC